jgi:hypothetical protein
VNETRRNEQPDRSRSGPLALCRAQTSESRPQQERLEDRARRSHAGIVLSHVIGLSTEDIVDEYRFPILYIQQIIADTHQRIG